MTFPCWKEFVAHSCLFINQYQYELHYQCLTCLHAMEMGSVKFFSNGRSIKLRNHNGRTKPIKTADRQRWPRGYGMVCAYRQNKSAFSNLLIPLSESIHFLPQINKLPSHVLTLFCLLSERSLLFWCTFESQICKFYFSVQNRSYFSQTF